ncbi:MAG: MoaD/ThiS family protein [Proteobacteria bacterium]|nr:MoaD/ThiS family protein [Pseudomonadota bacterium]
MPVVIRIPTPLRSLTRGQDEVHASGQDVRQVIDDLDRQFPGLRDQLCDSNGVRRFVNVYANEEDIRFLNNLDTPLKEGDYLSIVPAIAGGRPWRA